MALIDRDTLVCIGRVHSAHSMGGELKVVALTDDPGWYAGEGGLVASAVYLDGTQGLRSMQVQSLREHAGGWMLRLEGLEDRAAAEAMTGDELLLEPGRLKPLAEGEVLLHDLLGCSVYTGSGELLGTVREVMETGANSVLWLDGGSGEVAVPWTQEVVTSVDLSARRIVIEPLPGLLELNR